MAAGPINLTKNMQRQGLDPTMIYEARVVNNNDPRQLGRIQARIAGVFDGLEDEHLPWAVPCFNHVDGAFNDGGDAVDRSGIFYVPRNNHIVGLRFPTAEPYRCIWGDYTVDEKTQLPETKKNYPKRQVIKMANGTYLILDSETNELFVNHPGDLDLTILGDVNQYIVGNQQLVVSDNMGDIASYLMDAPDTVLSRLTPKPTKEIEFMGLLGPAPAGNQHTYITGDQTTLIKGNRMTVIEGNDVLRVLRNRTETIDMVHRIQALRSETNG